MKTNEDTPILSGQKCLPGSFLVISGLCGYLLQFSREEASVESGVVESGQLKCL